MEGDVGAKLITTILGSPGGKGAGIFSPPTPPPLPDRLFGFGKIKENNRNFKK
jgi:hypothetical protein